MSADSKMDEQHTNDSAAFTAQQAELASEKARLLAVEQQRVEELEVLRTTLADITSQLDLPALLHTILERASGLVGGAGGELRLYDEDSQEIQIVVSHGLSEDYVGTRHRLGEGAMGRVAQTGEPLISAPSSFGRAKYVILRPSFYDTMAR